jgi:predicted ArsR family transcriptional regulator
MAIDDLDRRIAGIASLAEPQRRALYRLIARHSEPVSKDQAAAALGVARSVAAFHLDRLVDEGLLVAEYRRLTGRQGPGAGRPAKLYRRAERGVAVSVPPRSYDLAALLLARAVDEATRSDEPVAPIVARVAAQHGRRLGQRARQLASPRPSQRALGDAALAVLEEEGYEPRPDGGEVVLANCPFHALVEEQRDLVCNLNYHLLDGLADAVGGGAIEARLAPADGVCCVRIRRSGRQPSQSP